jgi:2,3-bisphosphoglycerate-dependent phosphoglycerate mutase
MGIATALMAAQPAISAAADAAASDPPLQIWFIRHAESQINIADNPRPVPDGGMSYPLTRKGVAQARALADATADVPITAIYTSTHLRAVQTADAIALRHELTIDLAPEAVEIRFDFREGSSEEQRAAYLELARKWTLAKDFEARAGTGESFAEAQRRFLPFVREIMNRHAQDSGVVVVMAHGATIGLLVPMLASNVPADFGLRHSLPNTGIVKTELRDSRLLCTEWAGISNSQFGE